MVKRVCCDTSFLFSLYGRDVHTDLATAQVQRLRSPLTVSVLNQFEFENAMRLAAWRRLSSVAEIDLSLGAFAADLQTGDLLFFACDLGEIFKEARRLSAIHTGQGGHRPFDILHVAAAIYLEADEFLSFDTNQRKLARGEGLKLNP